MTHSIDRSGLAGGYKYKSEKGQVSTIYKNLSQVGARTLILLKKRQPK
jgi:hypothetical protein